MSADTDSAGPDMIVTADAAEMINVSPKTLANQRSRGEGPPYVRYSRGAVRYSRKAIERWLTERTVDPGPGPAS